MSFKRSDERMRRVTATLDLRMTERGIGPDVRRKVIDSIGSFALYGFPESHAISFALIAYASCWLKVHHPAEFYAGLLNHQPMGFYSVNTLIQDAKRRHIRIRPVSCITSNELTEVTDDHTIRLGLHHLKGLTQETTTRILTERGRRVFDSLDDFMRRVRPSAKEKRLLARAGALNGLEEGGHRRQLLWQVELPLFDDMLRPRDEHAREVLPMMSDGERLSADFATQGASTGPHPMAVWRKTHGTRDILRATDLVNLPHGVPITVAGMAICRQRPGTAKGHCFISLEDETGIANLFVNKETFQRLRMVIVTEAFLLASGLLQRSEADQPTVFVTHIEPLSNSESGHVARSHDFH
jgi:error-prone DNA polymerase